MAFSGSAGVLLGSVVHSVCCSFVLCVLLRIARYFDVLQMVNEAILHVLAGCDMQMIYQDCVVLAPYILGLAVMHWRSGKQRGALRRNRFQAEPSANVKLYYLAL